jgi:hypothetical protein
VPFIRHTRDKRGYETTYVMHAYRPQPGPQRTRILYLFRSPSHVKLGRRALDEEAREALEHTHPDVSFDWTLLGRESMAQQRPEPSSRERPTRARRPAPSSQPAPAPKPVPVVMDDQSILGQTVGAETAARLRAQYAELLERILRRSRTPEERDRLSERAHRLNPDDWPDEAEVRTGVAQFESERAALMAELPSRRRGRRGGRRPVDGPSTGPSGIIEERDKGETDDAGCEDVAEAGGDRSAGAAADRDGVGTERPDPDLPSDG